MSGYVVCEGCPWKSRCRGNVRELLGKSYFREDFQQEISLISTLAYPLDYLLAGGLLRWKKSPIHPQQSTQGCSAYALDKWIFCSVKISIYGENERFLCWKWSGRSCPLKGVKRLDVWREIEWVCPARRRPLWQGHVGKIPGIWLGTSCAEESAL